MNASINQNNKINNNLNGGHHVQFVFDDVDNIPLPSTLYISNNKIKISEQKEQEKSFIPICSTSSSPWQMPLILTEINNDESQYLLKKQLILNNQINGETLTKKKRKKQKGEQKENCENQTKIPIKLKIVLVGSGCVGKSSLTIQFVQQYFITEHDPTISDIYIKNCFVDDVLYRVEVVDTAGQDEFSEMREPHFQTGDGFLLVFSVSSRSSLEYMLQLRESIERYKDCKNFPMILVGNKCDLELEREISRLEAEDLAASLNIPYIESSAKFRQNVDQIFHILIRQIRHFRQLEQQQYNEQNNSNIKYNNGCIENNLEKRDYNGIKQKNEVKQNKKKQGKNKIKKSGICRIQ
ncbi:Ras-related protein R-Ras2 [Meloidogyne graminicola]|uniref:Ras-related protein R-Ras2 n=1 Tax=Meloidogyne graminicola TaxID=189291 RepID=A0A8T0A3S7_9BILA|nr:Ras-related protein R-Ras2 [Meloidogyne graminicola]